VEEGTCVPNGSNRKGLEKRVKKGVPQRALTKRAQLEGLKNFSS